LRGLHSGYNDVNTLVENHRQYLKSNARTTFGDEVVKRAFKQAIGRDPEPSELTPWVDDVAAKGLIYPELTAKLAERHSIIQLSYMRAFGRSPDPDELRYWLGVAVTDARVASADALIKNHQQFAKDNADNAFGYSLVKRAFKEATGLDYNQEDYYQNIFENLSKYPLRDLFESATRELRQNGALYKDLVWYTRVNGAFRLAYGRAPSATEQGYWQSVFGIICDQDCDAAFLKAWSFGNVLEKLREHLRSNVRGQFGVDVLDRTLNEAIQYPYVRQLGSSLDAWDAGSRQATLQAIQQDVADGRVLDYYDILLDVWIRKAYLNEFERQPTLDELKYWLSLPRSDPRVQGRGPVLNALRDIKWTANYVRAAHQYAFNVAPSPDEEARWVNLFRDRPASSVAQVVEEMRKELRSNGELSKLIVQRAFNQVYDWQRDRVPSPEQYAQYQGWAYTEVAEDLARRLIRFTYDKLINAAPDPHTERYYVSLLVHGNLSPADLWDRVATSQERLDRFGYYAPARISYGEYPDSPGNPRRPKKEQCLGDIGPGECRGVADKAFWMPAPKRVDEFTTPDGRKMFYVESPTAVGSIVHDVACTQVLERGQLGAWCNGFEQGIFWEARLLADLVGMVATVGAAGQAPLAFLLAPAVGKLWSELLGKASVPAALEWNKAVWNTIQGRWWLAKYGPYSEPLTEWSDDLTTVPARSAKMAPLVFGLGWFDQTQPYGGVESRSTAALKAPPGTYMDATDAAFCSAGSFSKTDDWLISKWGTCK
jgi:hypothetical protein